MDGITPLKPGNWTIRPQFTRQIAKNTKINLAIIFFVRFAPSCVTSTDQQNKRKMNWGSTSRIFSVEKLCRRFSGALKTIPFKNTSRLMCEVKTTQQPRSKSRFIFALLPLTAFGLGTWQVRRLAWKTELIESSNKQFSQTPEPLPKIDSNSMYFFSCSTIF